VYAQRIDNGGNLLWESGGVKVSATSMNPRSQMVSDDLGGALIAYGFQQDGMTLNIQKIGTDGRVSWGNNGMTVIQNGYAGYSLSPDGMRRGVIGWGIGGIHTEQANVRKVRSDGNLMWGQSGNRLNKR